MRIPDEFAREISRREGAAGRAWLASLPALAQRCCRDWQLTIDGAPLHGYVAVALSIWYGQASVPPLESAPCPLPPISGDAEYGVIPLLWNRMDESTLDWRFAAVVAAAGLDADRARAWTFVRGVHNWLWTLDSGGFPGSARLAEITRWAAGADPG